MSKVKLTCSVCGDNFLREKKEHTRSQKLGRAIFCGLKCSGSAHARFLPPTQPEDANRLNSANRRDQLSPFRWHLRNLSRRSNEKGRRLKEVAIQLQDLKDQWDLQGGVCPYTGWQLKNMPTTSPTDQLPLTPDRASLDRIDSTKGYVRGNIQFVSVMAQYAKNGFSEQELLNFCKQVVEYHARS